MASSVLEQILIVQVSASWPLAPSSVSVWGIRLAQVSRASIDAATGARSHWPSASATASVHP